MTDLVERLRDNSQRNNWSLRQEAATAPDARLRVKQLEWVEDDDNGRAMWRARTDLGPVYTVYDDGFSTPPYRLCLHQLHLGSFNIVGVAQSAAQADFEQRIRSALSPAGADEGKESEGGSRKQPFDPADAAGVKSGTVTFDGQTGRPNRDEVGASQTPGSSMSFAADKPIVAEQAFRPSDPTPPDPKPWPDGCRNPNSCSIHRDCMYLQCKHYDRDISGEVDASLQKRVGG
jgi:hypothetical protein